MIKKIFQVAILSWVVLLLVGFFGLLGYALSEDGTNWTGALFKMGCFVGGGMLGVGFVYGAIWSLEGLLGD